MVSISFNLQDYAFKIHLNVQRSCSVVEVTTQLGYSGRDMQWKCIHVDGIDKAIGSVGLCYISRLIYHTNQPFM